MTRRFGVLAWGALLLGSLAIAIPAGAESQSDAGGIAGTFLIVELRGGNFAQDQERLEIGLRFESVKRAPGRITLYVPRGFAIGSNALPGTPLGSVSILTADPFEVLQGSIAVLPLDVELVERARSCTDRDPSAAWALTVEGPESRVLDAIAVMTDRINVAGKSATFSADVSVGVADAQLRVVQPRTVRVTVQIDPVRTPVDQEVP